MLPFSPTQKHPLFVQSRHVVCVSTAIVKNNTTLASSDGHNGILNRVLMADEAGQLVADVREI